MDPLSLLTRLATSVPPPRFHTVRYSGVLAAASGVRSLITPEPPQALVEESEGKGHGQRLPSVGGVAPPHVCRGRAHLSFLPRAHEAAGGDPGSGASRPVPRCGRGGDGGAPPLPRSWSAPLEEPSSPQAGARPGEGLRQQDRRDGRDRIATARSLAAGRTGPCTPRNVASAECRQGTPRTPFQPTDRPHRRLGRASDRPYACSIRDRRDEQSQLAQPTLPRHRSSPPTSPGSRT